MVMVGMWQRCSIARGVQPAGDFGTVGKTIYSVVAADIECRLDTVFEQISRAERMPEEFIGRRHGILIFYPTVDVRDRDVIILDGEQWDVQYNDPVSDSYHIHHLEVVVLRRDNPLVIT